MGFKEGVGQGAAEAFVEEQEENGDLAALVGEVIGAAGAFEQVVGFEFAQVVAQLGDRVVGLIVGLNDRLMELPGGPAGQARAGVQERLEQPDHARFVEFDPRQAHGAAGDREGQALKEREVEMDGQRGGERLAEAVEDGAGGLTEGRQVGQGFFQAQVGQVVGADLHAQEGPVFLVHFDE